MAEIQYGRSRVARARLSVALVATLAAFTLAGPTEPAHAAVVEVSDSVTLIEELSEPTTTVIKLTDSFVVPDTTLQVPRSVILDLNGWVLTTKNITLSPGADVVFTVQDTSAGSDGKLDANALAGSEKAGITNTDATIVLNSGFVSAQGALAGAGIGTNRNSVSSVTVYAGSVVVRGGTVNATGGQGGAGIGGGESAHGGTVLVEGGTVVALGGTYGAGIGGGSNGNGATMTFTGGTTTATAGEIPFFAGSGAGIGGGDGGNGGTVLITSGAQVTAKGVGGGSAVGAGGFNAAPSLGSLTVAGTLTLDNTLKIPNAASVQITETGVLTGAGAVNGLNSSSAGSIANAGAITNTTIDSLLAITVNNYLVTFDSNGSETTPATQAVRVYAPTFTAGIRTIPTPVRTGETLTGWNTEPDGTGTAFDATAVLDDDLTVYAQWAPASITVTPATAIVTAGDTSTFAVEGFDNHGDSTGDSTAQVTFASDEASDQITGNSIRFTTAGTHTITATLTGDPSVTTTTTVTVNPGLLASIGLHLSDVTVDEGDTITGTVTGEDAYGNDLGDLTGQATFTSDHATDMVDGNRIQFPTASTHLITATIGTGSATVTAQQAVTVNPAAITPPGATPPSAVPPTAVEPAAAGPADSLASTGYTTGPALLLAALLITVLGAGLKIAAVRRRHELRSRG